MSTPSKVLKISKKIGTHNGAFHCDEALGCYLLKQLPEYKDAVIVRSRDPKTLDDCDIVIDVGGVYDNSKLRFDHHQAGFNEVFEGFNTKLSSAGLVYKHFGQRVIATILNKSIDDLAVQKIYKANYKHFMEAIDAVDNGINQWTGDQKPLYINNTHLSSRVGRLIPFWNEDQSNEIMDKQFEKSMQLAGSEFLESVHFLNKAWLPARDIVEQALNARTSIDESGEILYFPTATYWKEHLYELEEEMNIKGSIKFCIYKDSSGSFRVQAVNLEGSFKLRLPMPTNWRGLRDEQLSKESGIEACVFVHAAGFIGGNKTYEGALDMARKSLNINDNK